MKIRKPRFHQQGSFIVEVQDVPESMQVHMLWGKHQRRLPFGIHSVRIWLRKRFCLGVHMIGPRQSKLCKNVTESAKITKCNGRCITGCCTFFVSAVIVIALVLLSIAIWDVFAQHIILCFVKHGRDLSAIPSQKCRIALWMSKTYAVL